MIVRFIAALILTEAVTELIVEAEIFESIRLRIMALGKFLERLLTCGYCMSVWVGVVFAYLFRLHSDLLIVWWLEPFFWGLVLHRLSGLLHDLYGIARRLKFPAGGFGGDGSGS
jgi:hypothetical protein